MSWMTQTEAAAALGCSIRTIRRRIRAGSIGARREGRRLLVEVDTDKAMATVTQVGRQLAEVGAAAAIQRKQENDALSTIHSTFKDTLDVLAAYRERAEREVSACRRAARWGWMAAAMLAIAIVGAGWFIHTERVTHERLVQQAEMEMQAAKSAAETAIVTAEIRHAGEMTTQTAAYEAGSAAIRESLEHERAVQTELGNRLASAEQLLADRTAELRVAARERDSLARGNDDTVRKLQSALMLSKLKGTVQSMWANMRASAAQSTTPNREGRIPDVVDQVLAEHKADFVNMQRRNDRQLALLLSSQEKATSGLQSSISEREAAQRRLEERNNELADKLVAAVTERSYLAAEHDRLARDNAELRARVDELERANKMAASVKAFWSALRGEGRAAGTYGPTLPQDPSANENRTPTPQNQQANAVE